MTMKVECYGCGEDCSHAYATYLGYPYHFSCLPDPPPKRKKTLLEKVEEAACEPLPYDQLCR